MDNVMNDAVLQGLSGKMAHVSPEAAFEALDWRLVGELPSGVGHSIWEILNHLIYWQNYSLSVLSGENPTPPAHASDSWQCSPKPDDEAEWENTVDCFIAGLEQAKKEAQVDPSATIPHRPSKTRLDMLLSLIGHNSYHLGQIVILRQCMHAWPPPSGGDTW